jgi:hypothetical protein
MNGTSRTNTNFEPDDDGLDPELIQLFDAADAPSHPQAFVSTIWAKLKAAQRVRLIRRCIGVAIMMLAGALLAPYAARATLTVADWIASQLPAAVLAIASCTCAALIAWRTARRQLG